MTEFTSETRTIPCGNDRVFGMLSDLSNLDRAKNQFSGHTLKDFAFDKDSFSFVAEPVGRVTFQIVEREPNTTIKFQATNSPLPLTLWIKLEQTAPDNTKMKLTVHTELNPFIKPIVSKPLQDALDKVSELLVSLPY
jgi:hypothetical protein